MFLIKPETTRSVRDVKEGGRLPVVKRVALGQFTGIDFNKRLPIRDGVTAAPFPCSRTPRYLTTPPKQGF